MKSDKVYLLEKLEKLSKEGMFFPEVSDSEIFPSEKCVKNTRDIIESCYGEELNDWNISLSVNGSIIMDYITPKTNDKEEPITAVINVAENSVSGVLSYKDVYITTVDKIDNLSKIFDIFKKVSLYSSPKPTIQTLLKVFWMFDEHGLIKEDLCFEPEHFIATVISEHWDDTDERGNNIN